MVDGVPGYCPRCGTERVQGMGYCARCGLNLGEPYTGEGPPPIQPPRPPAPVTPVTPVRADPHRRPGGLVPMPLLALIAVGAVALLLYLGGLIGRAPAGTSPPPAVGSIGAPASPSAAPATALPVGLTILSPANGAVVGTKKVTVIGTAPPGLRIVQDISFGFDRSAMVDGTGHWAMELELAEGDNGMTFRIGDDRSTAQTIHVVYQPPAAS